MTSPRVLNSVRDLGGAEPHILDAINREARGSELFVVDPLRFLRENGFEVSAELQNTLTQRLQLGKLPVHLYDGIRAGTATLVPATGPNVSVRSIRINRLAIPAEEIQ